MAEIHSCELTGSRDGDSMIELWCSCGFHIDLGTAVTPCDALQAETDHQACPDAYPHQ